MKEFERLKEQIEQLRDEIKLKVHLGAADAKDELEKLEKQWDELMTKYKPVTDEVGNTAEKTIDALGTAADELKAGLERLRKLF